MSKAVQNKMNRIISKDYSSARIRKGEEWYIGHGIFMDRQDTKEHLLDQMDIMKDIVKSVAFLQSSIESQIMRCQITGNLFSSVLELGESLSWIEKEARQFLEEYSALRRNELHERSLYYDDDVDLPF